MGHVASDLAFHPDYRPSQWTSNCNPLQAQASNMQAINHYQEAHQGGDSETDDMQEDGSKQESGKGYRGADGRTPYPLVSQAQGVNNR